MQVNLVKKETSYEQDGEVKTATAFYVECGDQLIGIQPVYKKSKSGERDKTYATRKAVLSAFATPIDSEN